MTSGNEISYFIAPDASEHLFVTGGREFIFDSARSSREYHDICVNVDGSIGKAIQQKLFVKDALSVFD